MSFLNLEMIRASLNRLRPEECDTWIDKHRWRFQSKALAPAMWRYVGEILWLLVSDPSTLRLLVNWQRLICPSFQSWMISGCVSDWASLSMPAQQTNLIKIQEFTLYLNAYIPNTWMSRLFIIRTAMLASDHCPKMVFHYALTSTQENLLNPKNI